MKFIYNALLFLGLTGNEQPQVNAAGQVTKVSKSKTDLVSQWFKTIEKGNLSELAQFVGKIDVNIQNEDGDTALAIAICKGREDVVKFLLSVDGIDVNATSKEQGYAALHVVGETGYSKFVKLLVDAGANVNIKTKSGWTPLEMAACKGQGCVVAELLKVPGIDVNSQDENGSTALIWAAYKMADTDIYTVRYTADHSEWIYSPIIDNLIKAHGIDVNIQNHDGDTALIWAVSRGFAQKTQTLLEAPGIKLNARNKQGQTALMIAREKAVSCKDWQNHPFQSILSSLYRKIGPSIKEASEAVKNRETEKFKKIVEQIGVDALFKKDGADIVIDATGTTLLDRAFEMNHFELIESILKNSKDPQGLLARFPFEVLNPATDLFKYFVALGYGQHEPFMLPESTKKCGSEIESSKLCAKCQKPSVERCSTCKKVYYCSVACQKADWENHKACCIV